MLEPLGERDGAEGLGRSIRAGRVRDPLAVLGAVAGVLEGRVRGEPVGVEGCGRRDDLERRARGEETVRGPVQERRRRLARTPDGLDLVEVALDQVRVVRRLRGERVDLAGLRVHDHRGAALAGQLRHRDSLNAGADTQDQVVAGDRDAFELVDRLVEKRPEVRVRGGQVGVLGLLETRARAHLRRIADQLCEESAGRIAPEVERLPADLAAHVGREHRPVGRADHAALDPELGDPLDRVVLLLGQARRCPGLPVGRPDDQRCEQDQRRDGELGDLAVHAPLGALARLETRSSPASRTKFATTLEPP